MAIPGKKTQIPSGTLGKRPTNARFWLCMAGRCDQVPTYRIQNECAESPYRPQPRRTAILSVEKWREALTGPLPASMQDVLPAIAAFGASRIRTMRFDGIRVLRVPIQIERPCCLSFVEQFTP
jgi:hypothetical protein